MGKLNPPSVSSSLPSFCNTSGTVNITVPFSMNKTVGPQDIGGFSLRIKNANTDTVLGIIDKTVNNFSVTGSLMEIGFALPEKIVAKMIIGQFYKIQLAYKDKAGTVGYYSSIGVAKYTTYPQVTINEFDLQSTNLHSGEFVGVYTNQGDSTEKVYQYKFTLYDSVGKEIESSGWKLHNTYTDEESWCSSNYYVLKTALVDNHLYKIQYSIITNNGLEVNSPRYPLMQAESIDPEIGATLYAELDYDNACITVRMKGVVENNKEKAFSGSFIVSRASSDTNFNVWTTVHDFKLKGQLPSSFIFRDFTIEQGVVYRYALQQYNSSIQSNRIYAEDVTAYFEDAFLFDGHKQLRIKFNPKVSSFKTNYLDTKKTTLGSQYPFIFRNGAVAYKEFPINGLISYAVDNEEFFCSREKDLLMPKNWQFTTDIIDENIAYERRFKLEVMDWLNNGDLKLFKSPTEGNYLVRLMNVNLTPVDSVSRMLHNFSCTANEVATFNIENLTLFNFLNIEPVETGALRWQTILLDEYVESHIANSGNNIGVAYDNISKTDMLRGFKCYHLRIADCVPGTHFVIDALDYDPLKQLNIVIGSTGYYEAKFEEPRVDLRLLSPSRQMTGSVTYGVYTTTTNKFDAVNKINIYDVSLMQVFGPSENLFENYVDLKRSISRIYFARFSGLDVEPVANYQTLEYLLAEANKGTDVFVPRQFSPYKIYFTLDTQEYYTYNGYNFEKQDGYDPTVTYDNVSLSVEQDNEIVVPELDRPPQVLKIGDGVCAEISFQVKEISYNVEADLIQEKNAYENAYTIWRAACINFRQVQSTAELKNKDIPCYVLKNHTFRELTDIDRDSFNLSVNNQEYRTSAWTVNTVNGKEVQISQQRINDYYQEYKRAQRAFMEPLAEKIKEQEEELQQ